MLARSFGTILNQHQTLLTIDGICGRNGETVDIFIAVNRKHESNNPLLTMLIKPVCELITDDKSPFRIRIIKAELQLTCLAIHDDVIALQAPCQTCGNTDAISKNIAAWLK